MGCEVLEVLEVVGWAVVLLLLLLLGVVVVATGVERELLRMETIKDK